jgi:hypothetical protein
VEKAHRRIKARFSQASLKADIAKKCRLVNDKRRLWMPSLIPLRAPKDFKKLIASSKHEAEDLTT